MPNFMWNIFLFYFMYFFSYYKEDCFLTPLFCLSFPGIWESLVVLDNNMSFIYLELYSAYFLL